MNYASFDLSGDLPSYYDKSFSKGKFDESSRYGGNYGQGHISIKNPLFVKSIKPNDSLDINIPEIN